MQRSEKTRRLWSVLLVAVLAVVLAAGCGQGSREAGLIGSWKVDAAAMNSALDKAPAATDKQKTGLQMAKQMLGNASLEIKEGKAFSMTMGFPMEGTWSWDEAAGSLSLTITKMMGMELSKMPNASKTQEPLVCTLSPDGKQLTVQSKAGQATPGSGAMIFVKQ